MCAFLPKAVGLSSFLPPPPPHRHSHRLVPLTSPLPVTPSARPWGKKIGISFVASYIVDEAVKVSTDTDMAEIEFSDGLDSVIQILKDIGVPDSQLNTLSSFDPLLLSYSETFQLWVREIVDAGFSKEVILLLIQYNPMALALKNPVPWLLFWREFVGNNDKVLLKVIRKNRLWFNFNTEEYVEPRLSLFREYSLSNQQIALLLMRVDRVMFWSLDYLKWVFEQTRELGLQPGSRMFLRGVVAVGSCTKTKFNRRIEFLMKFGWSKDEVYSNLRKYPTILMYTEERIRSHMDFLIRMAMLDPRSIALSPFLLGCSLERRLVPRHLVMTMLREHGVKKEYKLGTVCVLSEKAFLERCVVPHEKDVPGLHKAYAAACSGKVPI